MSSAPANSNAPSPGPKRLLAIDDNFESAELIARIGTACGYETKPIMDPRTVPDILEDWKPDVLTLDLCMPHKDGFSILTSLQEIGFKGSLIVISAQNDWLRKAACQLAEVNGIEVTSHLQKPINLRALRDLLNTIRLVC
jgi:CheY-like chemotaxis protein